MAFWCIQKKRKIRNKCKRNIYLKVASEDEPQSLAEAEQLLNQHAAIREEIDGYAEDYKKMRAMGDRVTQDQTDPQCVFFFHLNDTFS